MRCPTGWVVTQLLVLSVNLQLFLKSFTEVWGHRRVWGQSVTCSLKDLMNGMGVLEQLLGHLCELIPSIYVNTE